jgi:molecular chaperone HtpG
VEDYDNRNRIVSLLLFQSSNDPEKLTTLNEYVERMREGQNEIYYLTGESRSVVENSPHLEAAKEKGYEVLYLVEPVDELLVQSEEETAGMLQLLQKALDEHVKQVRLTTRLVSSPACLVVGAVIDYSPQMERLLMKGKGGGPKQPGIIPAPSMERSND